MTKTILFFSICAVALAQNAAPKKAKAEPPMQPNGKWRVHDMSRPRPVKVTPGVNGQAPSDAVVLFDGKDLSHWRSFLKNVEGEPKWKVENGYMEVVRGTGSLITKEKFGNAQFHVEWATPSEVTGSGQGRGNSGVYLMRQYEIQVLDSWENDTYPDGQAAALYGQYPPLVNASRKPGEWQSYDIIFEAPVFDGEKNVKPPYVTVLHNGVVVQNHTQILGRPNRDWTYAPVAAEESLMLQDHPGPVRFRNVWARRLKQQE